MMKKYIAPLFCLLLFSSCQVAEFSDLKKIETAVTQHIKNNDGERKLHTNIELLKAISYTKLEANEVPNSAEAYIGKVYLKAKWSYLTGDRVYNISDTLEYSFDKSFHVIKRIE